MAPGQAISSSFCLGLNGITWRGPAALLVGHFFIWEHGVGGLDDSEFLPPRPEHSLITTSRYKLIQPLASLFCSALPGDPVEPAEIF